MPSVVQTFKALLLVTAFSMSACSSVTDEVPEQLEFSENSAPLVEARMVVNEKTPVGTHYLSRLRALERYVKDSKVFSKIDDDVKSPVVIELELNRDNVEGGVNPVSAATLFVVPVKVVNNTSLKVKVKYEKTLLKEYSYEEQHETSIGLFNADNYEAIDQNEYIAIKNLVVRFLNDLKRDEILPEYQLEESYPALDLDPHPEPEPEEPATTT